MLVDTHCHLNFKAFKKDLDQVIQRAKESGIEKIIIPGAKMNSSRKGIEIATKYDGIFAAVGIHPHHAQEYSSGKSDSDFLDELRILAQNKKTVAIGEIGLDHFQYKNYPEITENEKDNQVLLFLEQLKIAKKFKKPVIIHCREAQNLILDTLRNFIKKSGPIHGVFHCFEGNEDYLKKVLDMGFYIGFDGNITYPENNSLIKLVHCVPKNRLLLETDSPFLTPMQFRGTRNEPSFILKTAEFIAGKLKVNKEKLAKQTTDNANLLFVLK